jgi:aryl-alcohol dehydrogenase-like predicted oxidoreductase
MAYEIPRTVLGRTGLTVTRLGIGGAYCESADGYRKAIDAGVNYMDTARAYRDGEDEKVIGTAIKGQRDALILATKTAKRDAKSARTELETSLQMLGVDYIDVYQLHHLNTQEERDQALAPGGALEMAQKARDEGLIRFIGVTGHDWVQIQHAVATGFFDTVLCWYNCAMKTPEETVFPAADKHNTGVVIMNASRNDRLFGDADAPSPEQFYRYVLSHKSVNLTIMGLRDIERFHRVAEALSEQETLASEARIDMEKYGAQRLEEGALTP